MALKGKNVCFSNLTSLPHKVLRSCQTKCFVSFFLQFLSSRINLLSEYGPLEGVSEAKNRSDLCAFSSSEQELDFDLTAEKAFVPPVGGLLHIQRWAAPLQGPKMAPMTLKEGSIPVKRLQCTAGGRPKG